MEGNKNDIDNFFRKNLTGFETENRKGNWELMNHLLDEETKKRKRRLIVLFLFAGLLITAGLILILPKQGTRDQRKLQQVREMKTDPPRQEIKPIQSEPPSSFEAQLNQRMPDSKITTSKNNQKLINPTNASAQRKESLSSHRIKNNSIISSQEETNVKNIQLVITSETDITPEEKGSAENTKDPISNPLPGTGQSSFDSSGMAEMNLPVDTSIDSLTTSTTSNDSLVTYPDSLPASDTLKIKSTQSREFLLYAGINAFESGYSSVNFSPIIGVGIRSLLGDDFKVEVAGLYSLQGGYHLNDTETVVSETYFLDKKTDIYSSSISIRKQHKIYFPITFYYMISEKHALLAAAQISILLNTEGNYSEKNIVSGNTTGTSKQNVKGYMDGIRTTNYSISLGYQYTFSRRFDVQVKVTRDLSGTYDEDYFHDVTTGALWSAQAFIIFRF